MFDPWNDVADETMLSGDATFAARIIAHENEGHGGITQCESCGENAVRWRPTVGAHQCMSCREVMD